MIPRTCRECPRWTPHGARVGDCSVGIETFSEYPICDAMRCFLGLPTDVLPPPTAAPTATLPRCYVCGCAVRAEEQAVLPSRRGTDFTVHLRCILK